MLAHGPLASSGRFPASTEKVAAPAHHEAGRCESVRVGHTHQHIFSTSREVSERKLTTAWIFLL